ncbi:hypothetical protein CP533_2453 [Ophiocordyceps camponoti-saundersi (nom. inval.)]|nr:hypothetical protein CP533_2453 [Ophiocordyceps camponoti-saundersi (nom. inval.)]
MKETLSFKSTPPRSSSIPSNPLHLTIRFSSSIPDLDMDITYPDQTTVLSLKHLLRSRLASRNRLRLIHQGRILPDTCALSAVLKPIPSHVHHHNGTEDEGDDYEDDQGRDQEHLRLLGKGKAPASAALFRIYVNCSIGDELSDEDLAAEERASNNPPNDLDTSTGRQQPRARPRPRGFDRFLQSGFTTSEISALRAQFALIQSSRFLPDSMPSPDTMRSLEDAWIDSNAGQMTSAANPLDDDVSLASYIDVLIRGLAIGFYFPLGSFAWLLRGTIWSEKWRLFVSLGVILTLATGVVRSISEQN